MERKIRINENGKIEVISREGVMTVESLSDAFLEFGIDMCQVTDDAINDATEVFESGYKLIYIDEIERAIYEYIAEDIQ
jgi:hypothetical protein